MIEEQFIAPNKKKTVVFQSLGEIDYLEAWKYQEKLFNETIAQKIRIRNEKTYETTTNYLIFCQHPHVFTLGKSGDPTNLLLNNDELKKNNASFYLTNRGGDITYHGPGQLVAYPIFDLEQFFTDIHKYMRLLEESVILTLSHYGIIAGRIPKLTGVWIDAQLPSARKICAMGVKSSRWVTMHGIGFNINSDLSYFSHIVPCGIQDKAVTSMQQELGLALDIQEVSEILKKNIAKLFEFEFID